MSSESADAGAGAVAPPADPAASGQAADAAAPASVDAAGGDSAPPPPAAEEPPKEPMASCFEIKETGHVGHVIFCGARLSTPQIQQILFEPNAWPLSGLVGTSAIFGDSDFSHPKSFVTPQLMALAEFKKQKKDATAQAKKVGKTNPAAAADPNTAVMGVVNGLLYSKLVTMVAALLEKAAAEQQVVVVDRVRAIAPGAELLLEAALEQASARPSILVIDSMQRLRKYEGEASSKCLEELERLRQAAKPLPAPPAAKGTAKKADKKPASTSAADAPADALTLNQLYTHTDFLEPAKFAKRAPPCTPDPTHANPRTKAVDPRLSWAYHYTQTIFGSGSHYLIFDEDVDAVELRGLAKCGTFCINGESANAVARLTKLIQGGGPLLMLNNTGGVTQAFASLHTAMVAGTAKGLPVASKKLLGKIQLVQPNQKWSSDFGLSQITMMQELEQRDAGKALQLSIAVCDVLNDGSDAFVARMAACIQGEPYTPAVLSKADKKKAAKAAKAAAKASADGEAPAKKSLISRLLGGKKKKNSVAPLVPMAGGDAVNGAVAAVAGVSDEESTRLKTLFDLIDRDHSGEIDFDEFKAGCFLMGFLENRDAGAAGAPPPPEEEMLNWFSDADADDSGRIDFGEFISLMKVEMKPSRLARKAKERVEKDAAAAATAAAAPEPTAPAASPAAAPSSS